MIKNWSIFLLALALFTSVMTLGLPTQAAKVCKVTDPTGTPLNVRDQPNGRIINALKNGREVNIEAITNDGKGRSWAKVSGYYKGEYRIWGWVLREFISCYES
jgi:hypothetical protein